MIAICLDCWWSKYVDDSVAMAAVGSPQAVLTEEDLALKEAAKLGETLDAPVSRKHRSSSRRVSVQPQKTSSKKLEVKLSKSLQSSKSGGDRHMIVPTEAKGMVLPFEPLTISFDDISYYVDMPAVSTVSQTQIFIHIVLFLSTSYFAHTNWPIFAHCRK